MNKIQEFIRERGGTAAVARDLGKPQSTISTWIKRKAIPMANWPEFEKAGVPWERLSDLHKKTNGFINTHPERV